MDWSWAYESIPIDDEGYTISFQPEDDFLPFLNEWGFVCVHILNEE